MKMKLNFKQGRIQNSVTDLRWFLAFSRLSSLLFTLLLLRVGPLQFLGPCCFGFGPRRLVLATFLLPGLGQGEGLVLFALNVPLVREEEPVEVGGLGGGEQRGRNASAEMQMRLWRQSCYVMSHWHRDNYKSVFRFMTHKHKSS